MFDSKKWLILFFVLALLGSIGGSLVAYLILEKKKTPATVAANPAPPAAASPVTSPAPPVVEPKVEPKVETATATVDESITPDFPIMSRAEWKAKPPVSAMKPHKPSIISIHHTATTAAPERSLSGKVHGLQEYSQHEGTLPSGKKKPAWPDLPYHFYIDVHGKVAEGADINFVGESATDYDATGHILVVLEGNFERAQPTKEQMDTLFKMVTWLAKKYKVPADKISSHKAFVSTACPGKNLESRLDEIRQHAWKP